MPRTKIPPPGGRTIASRVVRNLRETWPASVLNAAGAIPGFPSLDEIRRGYGRDARREPTPSR
jgi:hypothetical protein